MPRNEDLLVAELRRWGYAHANRYAYSRADRSRHVLEEKADGTRKSVEQVMGELLGRDGADRRRFMAGRAGLESAGLREVPAWAVDPIRARNDADRPHDNPEVAVDMGIPDDLRWIDRALAAMSRQYPLRAQIIRIEFTMAASQKVKTRILREDYGGSLTIRQYRYELGKAIDWLRGTQQMAA